MSHCEAHPDQKTFTGKDPETKRDPIGNTPKKQTNSLKQNVLLDQCCGVMMLWYVMVVACVRVLACDMLFA